MGRARPNPTPNGSLDAFLGPITPKSTPQVSPAASLAAEANPNSGPQMAEPVRVLCSLACAYEGTAEQTRAHEKFTHGLGPEARYEIRRLLPGGRYILEDRYAQLRRAKTRCEAREGEDYIYQIFDRDTNQVVF